MPIDRLLPICAQLPCRLKDRWPTAMRSCKPCRSSQNLQTLASHPRGSACNFFEKRHRTFLTESANSLLRLTDFAQTARQYATHSGPRSVTKADGYERPGSGRLTSALTGAPLDGASGAASCWACVVASHADRLLVVGHSNATTDETEPRDHGPERRCRSDGRVPRRCPGQRTAMRTEGYAEHRCTRSPVLRS